MERQKCERSGEGKGIQDRQTTPTVSVAGRPIQLDDGSLTRPGSDFGPSGLRRPTTIDPCLRRLFEGCIPACLHACVCGNPSSSFYLCVVPSIDRRDRCSAHELPLCLSRILLPLSVPALCATAFYFGRLSPSMLVNIAYTRSWQYQSLAYSERDIKRSHNDFIPKPLMFYATW